MVATSLPGTTGLKITSGIGMAFTGFLSTCAQQGNENLYMGKINTGKGEF